MQVGQVYNYFGISSGLDLETTLSDINWTMSDVVSNWYLLNGLIKEHIGVPVDDFGVPLKWLILKRLVRGDSVECNMTYYRGNFYVFTCTDSVTKGIVTDMYVTERYSNVVLYLITHVDKI